MTKSKRVTGRLNYKLMDKFGKDLAARRLERGLCRRSRDPVADRYNALMEKFHWDAVDFTSILVSVFDAKSEKIKTLALPQIKLSEEEEAVRAFVDTL
jgi:hypothetical protein